MQTKQPSHVNLRKQGTARIVSSYLLRSHSIHVHSSSSSVADLPLREVETLEKTLGERRRTLVCDSEGGLVFAGGIDDSRAENGYRICFMV